MARPRESVGVGGMSGKRTRVHVAFALFFLGHWRRKLDTAAPSTLTLKCSTSELARPATPYLARPITSQTPLDKRNTRPPPSLPPSRCLLRTLPCPPGLGSMTHVVAGSIGQTGTQAAFGGGQAARSPRSGQEARPIFATGRRRRWPGRMNKLKPVCSISYNLPQFCGRRCTWRHECILDLVDLVDWW